jgi:hypothetical protein
MKKKLKWIAAGVFVLVVLVCAGVPGLLWATGGGAPTIAVDYTAMLNERAASIPEDERAWPLLREAIIRLASVEQAEEDLLSDPVRWAGETEELRSILSRFSGERDLLIESSRRRGLGFITSEVQPAEFWRALGDEPPVNPGGDTTPTMLIGVLLPHLSELRGIAKILNADAWLAAETGDGVRFVEDVLAMLAISVFAEEHPTLINQLVGVACRAMLYGRITETLSEHPDLLSGSELDQLSSALADVHGGVEYRLNLDGERYFFLDAVQRMYTDDGAGNGEITAAGIGMLGALEASGGIEADDAPPSARIASGAARLFASDRKTIVGMYEDLLKTGEDWSGVPLWEREYSDSKAWERLEGPTADPGRLMISLMVPALSKAHLSADRVNQQREAVEAALAVHRWRAESGDWPASLDMLVPTHLPSVPIDRMVGEPLRYTVTAGGPLLYSLGMDRDDDGGKSAHRAMIWAPASRVGEKLAEDPAGCDGDWVFLEAASGSSDSAD